MSDQERAEEIIYRYLARMPDARTAYYKDPTYHAHIMLMRRLLSAVDMAMEDEGIEETTRIRVLRCVMYGVPSESEALERMADVDRRTAEAMRVR